MRSGDLGRANLLSRRRHTFSSGAVTARTTDFLKNFFPIFCVSCRLPLCGEGRCDNTQQHYHGVQGRFQAATREMPHANYLGCVRTSRSAGSPRLTTWTTRFKAGPKSFGSEIRPSAYTPMLCASFA